MHPIVTSYMHECGGAECNSLNIAIHNNCAESLAWRQSNKVTLAAQHYVTHIEWKNAMLDCHT